MSTQIGGGRFHDVYSSQKLFEGGYTTIPNSYQFSEGESRPFDHPARRKCTPAIPILHGPAAFIIDNGMWIGDTAITVNQDRNAMEIQMVDFNPMAQHVVPLGRGGKFGSMTVDGTRLNSVVLTHVFEYGLRQILNDAMADKTDDDGNPLEVASIVAKAEKRLAALYAGELRVRNGSAAEPIDPVEREAYRIARENLTVALRAKGYWPKKGTDKFQAAIDVLRVVQNASPISATEYIEMYLDAKPNIRREAKRRVNEATKLAEDVADLV